MLELWNDPQPRFHEHKQWRFWVPKPVDEIGASLLMLGACVRKGRAIKNAVEGVVVARGYRIELMVVAAGTTERETEKRLAHIVDHIFEHHMFFAVWTDSNPAGNRQIARGNRLLPALIVVCVGEQVAGQLLADKLVVRQVAVKAVDHIIAILECFGNRIIGGIPRGVGIANQVEPMTTPTLAVGGAGEQPFDQPRVGIGRSIVNKRINLGRCGGKSR